MVNIPILDWEDEKVPKVPCLLRVPYIDIDTIELIFKDKLYKIGYFHGIIAPYSDESVEFNVRSAARLQDRFPGMSIYAVVPRFKTYERLKAIFGAGFTNIIIPQYLGGVEYDHYFQFISNQDLDKLTLHVAGGEFSSPTWNLERWSWSKETL